MHASHTLHHHKRMPLTKGTEGSHNGRHSHGRSLRSRGRERRHWKSKNIGTDFCHRIMAPSRSSQSRSIRLSLGRSRDPCLNRFHDSHIDSPLTQTPHERRRDECFPNPGIGPRDKNPSRTRIVSMSFNFLHSVDFSRSRKTLLTCSCRMIQKAVSKAAAEEQAAGVPSPVRRGPVRGENEAGGFLGHPAKGFGCHSSTPVPTHR